MKNGRGTEAPALVEKYFSYREKPFTDFVLFRCTITLMKP